MIELILGQVEARVSDTQNMPGGKLLQVRDPQSGIIVSIPLDEASAKALAAGLMSGIVIANGPLPKNGKIN